MVSKNNTKQSLKVLQDWTDYDKSILNSISSEYYAKKGVDAFDNQSTNSNAVPNTVSNSYPHALSIVRMLKANLDELDSSSKIRVLECGAGAGLFARHFLLAAQEEGILHRLEYFLSDIAAHSLRQIQEKGVLEEFQALGIFRFVTLFLPNFDSVFDLEGNQIALDSLDLVVANYVVDTLPMIPLKKKEGGCFDKLQLKLSQKQFIQNQDLLNDLGFLSRLNITERWVDYDLTQASEMEKKYFHILESYASHHPVGAELRFSYFILDLIDSLKEKLNPNGLFYIYDIPSKQEFKKHYYFFANSVANLINEELIIKFVQSSNLTILARQDSYQANLLIVNAEQPKLDLVEAFSSEFEKTCNINIYNEIIKMINVIKSPQSVEILKFLVDKFQEIDGKSALSLTAKGLYHEAIKDYDTAMDIYLAVRKIDFLNECLIEDKINKLRTLTIPKTSFQIL
jgi:hypothetical protein